MITETPEVVTIEAYHQTIMEDPQVGIIAENLKPYFGSRNGSTESNDEGPGQ